jgi:hypothetical protein
MTVHDISWWHAESSNSEVQGLVGAITRQHVCHSNLDATEFGATLRDRQFGCRWGRLANTSLFGHQERH